MNSLSSQIEALILQHDHRGIARLRHHLRPGYCLRSAELLLDSKGTVLIGTGFPVSGSFESDGPIGAIALYHILTYLGYRPIFVCAPPISKIMARSFLTYEMPISDWEQSRAFVKKAFKELDPALVVSVERPGVAADGRYYNMHRDDITHLVAKYDLFFENGNCPRIAFGDGGNEIGMGNLLSDLEEMDIIPSVTPCDELVISSVSNWGVYGVIGIMSQLLNEDLLKLIDPESIARFLVANGCVDGITRRPESTEDGFPLQVGISIMGQIRNLVSAQKKNKIEKKEAIMSKIKVERKPAKERLEELGVGRWPIWTKESSEFPWSYDETETCYFLEGDVVVTPEGEAPVEVGKGDLVTFPQGMSCTWKIRKDVKKHYRFGSD